MHDVILQIRSSLGRSRSTTCVLLMWSVLTALAIGVTTALGPSWAWSAAPEIVAWEDVSRAQALGYKIPPEFLETLRVASGKQN